MKLVHWLCSVSMLLAVGCSSTPERSTAIETENRDEYVKVVTRRLDDFEKTASDLEGERRNNLMATIADARAELRGVESAPSGDWQRHRGRIDSRLERIRNMAEKAE